jgi:hypothetical protein
MSSAPTRTIGIVAQVVHIGLGHNSKGADGSQHATLGAVDLVDAVALPCGPALTPTRQVEVSREHLAWIALVVPVAIARAAAATEAAVPVDATIAIVVARISFCFSAFVSPYSARCLLTMRDATSSSRPVYRPVA